MIALDCRWFTANSGWRCSLVEQPTHALYVSSPVILADGKPIDFYLMHRSPGLFFSDDGLTLFALENHGIEIESRRQLQGLESTIRSWGFTLTENGAIEGEIPTEEFEWWTNKILRMFCAIAEWQAERIEQNDRDFGLTDEVERLLRMKAPNRELIANPHVTLKGVDYSFNFRWGTTLVDAIPPTAQSVSARLRKAILATQEDDDIDLFFILDDRTEAMRAARELPVLGQVARTTLLSDFERSYPVES